MRAALLLRGWALGRFRTASALWLPEIFEDGAGAADVRGGRLPQHRVRRRRAGRARDRRDDVGERVAAVLQGVPRARGPRHGRVRRAARRRVLRRRARPPRAALRAVRAARDAAASGASVALSRATAATCSCARATRRWAEAHRRGRASARARARGRRQLHERAALVGRRPRLARRAGRARRLLGALLPHRGRPRPRVDAARRRRPRRAAVRAADAHGERLDRRAVGAARRGRLRRRRRRGGGALWTTRLAPLRALAVRAALWSLGAADAAAGDARPRAFGARARRDRRVAAERRRRRLRRRASPSSAPTTARASPCAAGRRPRCRPRGSTAP